ncbi:MAG: nucleotidyltransferase domain-containing protein [Promethearchaeota archaeon]|nr:MAG: nucleotidyltransferase domain-containing protein [Candidatus Lokiarchaeota archaeon]
MNRNKNSDLSFIKEEYFKKRLRNYLKLIFSLDLNIRAVLLFGSVATGKAKYNDDYISDIDLLIVCDGLPNNASKRRKLIFKLTESVTSGIQDIWWTSREMEKNVESKFYLILDAFDEGVILYDPEDFLQELKEKLFNELKQKGVVKTELYWRWPIKKFGDKIEF